MTKITIDTSDIRHCRKCKKTSMEVRIVRHHKGNDKWLGRYNKKIRDDYSKFRGCVDLCDGEQQSCHMMIHYIYIQQMDMWTDWSPKGALRLKEILSKLCDRWLKHRVNNPQVPERWRQMWRNRPNRNQESSSPPAVSRRTSGR